MRLTNYLFLALLLLIITSFSPPPFANDQLQHSRVYRAMQQKDAPLEQLFLQKGMAYPPQQLYMRVFKSEKLMEVWSRGSSGRYELVKAFPVCAMSGDIGPKQKQGDKQVPEGFYRISHFNPNSQYHLSLKVDYPNNADRKRSKHRNLGGDIFIHGECGSRGCVSITDPLIQEIYWLSAQAKGYGSTPIPVHIFPARMSNFKYAILKHLYRKDRKFLHLWRSLKTGYDYFERHRQVPSVVVDGSGIYQVR